MLPFFLHCRRTSFITYWVPLFCLTLIGSFSALANPDRVRFKTWNTQNGLPQNSVNSIAQTPDGYIWLATNDGLARFDGIRFKVFKKSNTPELPMNRVKWTAVDNSGRLWIWTEDTTTLVVYRDRKFTAFVKGVDFEANDVSNPIGLPGELRFRAGGDDFVFAGEKFLKQPRRGMVPSETFLEEKDKHWIARGDSYNYISNGEYSVYSSETPSAPFRGVRSWLVTQVGDDQWLFDYPDGRERLYRLRDGKLEPTSYIGEAVTFFSKDRAGNLWVGNYQAGLDRIKADSIPQNDLANVQFERYNEQDGLPALDMTASLIDRDGNIWLGSSKGLHMIIDEPTITVYSKASGLPAENIYAVVQDQGGTIWFGAWPEYLVSYESGKFTWEQLSLVHALFADSNSKLWAGSQRTPLYRNSKSEPWYDVWKAYPHAEVGDTSVITQDRSGNTWIGGSDGVIRLNGTQARKFGLADGLPDMAVTSILQISSGEVLIGTVKGLAILVNDRIKALTVNNGLSGNFVRSLHEDRDGTVWIGTYDSGLTRYKNGGFAKITSANGLFSDGVFCILEDDDGWFWMSSNQGIYRVRRDELNDVADGGTSSVTSISYGPEDGLRVVEANGGKQPAGIKSSDGRLWFATSGGLAMIDPQKLRQRSVAPPVLIEDILIDQVEVKPDNGVVRIGPGNTSLDLSYTALNFRGAERMRFRYRLEGLDQNWTEAGTRRTANFSQLPYGEYTLRISALSPDGVWNNEGATLKIAVIPPFYQTIWFKALVATVVVLLIGGFYYLRLRQLQAINLAQSEFAHRLIDSQERERSRFAMELHDSLGQSLAVIRNRALMGLSTPDDNHHLVDQLSEISEASAVALEETRHIAHNLHPYQLEHLGLTLAVRSLVDTLEGSSELAVVADIQEVSEELRVEDSINIYRIAQESLSNIIKHSGATQANVTLSEVDGHLILNVSDNGRGFDPTSRARGLGLKGIHERAKILKADLKVHSETGKGSSIMLSFEIPVNGNERKDESDHR